MSNDSKIGTVLKAHCGRCGGERNCDVKGYHSEGGSEADGYYSWSVDWYLLVCRGCEYCFAQSVSTDSESYHEDYNSHGEHVREWDYAVQTWPAKSKRRIPDWFAHSYIESMSIETHAISITLTEIYRALDAELLFFASIGIRTCFDVASEALGVEPSLKFFQKLDKLLEGGHIIATQRETLEILVDAGSAAAHRGWQPRLDQIHTLMDILEEFISSAIVLPARRRIKAEKLESLKKSVPSRPRKEKKKVSGVAKLLAKSAPPNTPEADPPSPSQTQRAP